MGNGRAAIEEDPDPREVAFLEDQINEFNFATTGIHDGRLLASFHRSATGEIRAGIFGWTWGDCCEIRFLWVDRSERGQGHGSRLLLAAEKEAAARGCTQIVLSTHSFQAPVFYERHGYEVAGSVDGYPRGHQHLLLRKTLVTPA
ncbi:MAG: GNAT family N-acetyltransferase [Actinomycetota bacterium]|nr:GNAT family N-acetyltransferase [Actinomycetota bacterium]